MTHPRTALAPLLLLGVLLTVIGWQVTRAPASGSDGARVHGAHYRLTADAAREAGVQQLPDPAPLRFADGTRPADRDAVLSAIAGARPQARELIDRVAGLVTVVVAVPADGAVGEARGNGEGFTITLDLATAARWGARGIARVTLHELAHVIDHLVVPGPMEAQLDAATPPGWGCDQGTTGGCAQREERFAESFAKWAANDIGVGIDLGYRVPPPPPSWGAPLRYLR